MTVPPEALFDSFEQLFESAQIHARDQGYALVKARSSKRKNGLNKVWLACDRAGEYHSSISDEVRKRKTTTRKCGCLFSFFAREDYDGWQLLHRPEPPFSFHNHAPSASAEMHPALRKMGIRTLARTYSFSLQNSAIRSIRHLSYIMIMSH